MLQLHQLLFRFCRRPFLVALLVAPSDRRSFYAKAHFAGLGPSLVLLRRSILLAGLPKRLRRGLHDLRGR